MARVLLADSLLGLGEFAPGSELAQERKGSESKIPTYTNYARSGRSATTTTTTTFLRPFFRHHPSEPMSEETFWTSWCKCKGRLTKADTSTIRLSATTSSLTSTHLYHPPVFRPHRNTTYVDAACSYRPSSVVCRSVCHTSEPCKYGCTDRAAFWVEDLGGPGKPCIRWGSRSPMGRGKFFGENGRPIVKYRDILRSSVERRLN